MRKLKKNNLIYMLGFWMILMFLLFVQPKLNLVKAEQFSNSITPGSYWIVAKPESEFAIPYTISNSGDPTVISIQTYVVKVVDSEGNISLTPFPKSNSPYFNDINFSLNNSSQPLDSPFLIKTGEAVEFKIKGTISVDTKPGDYYFVFSAESSQPESFEKGTSIDLLGGVGSILYLSVSQKGDLEENATIASFNTNSTAKLQFGDKSINILDSNNRIRPYLKISNQGTNLIEIKGKISIKSSLNPTPRIVDIPTIRIPAESAKDVLSNLFDGDKPFLSSRFGFYEIKANVLYGQTSSPLTESVSFIVFPLKFTTAFMLIFLLTFIIWKKIKRQTKKF